MRAKRENATLAGVGVAACAVCCAGPILGVLAAIGIGTAAGFALFGAAAVLIGGAVAALVVVRRRRRAALCTLAAAPFAVPVELEARRASHAG